MIPCLQGGRNHKKCTKGSQNWNKINICSKAHFLWPRKPYFDKTDNFLQQLLNQDTRPLGQFLLLKSNNFFKKAQISRLKPLTWWRDKFPQSVLASHQLPANRPMQGNGRSSFFRRQVERRSFKANWCSSHLWNYDVGSLNLRHWKGKDLGEFSSGGEFPGARLVSLVWLTPWSHYSQCQVRE